MPSDQFSRSVAANVSYWGQQVRELDELRLLTIDRDRQNLYRAVDYGLRLPETWRETAELVLNMLPLIDRQYYWQEWIPILEQLLANCPEGELALKGQIMDQLGLAYRRNRQFDAALAIHLKEEQIGLTLKDLSRLAHARLQIGTIYWRKRQHLQAEPYAEAALEGFTELGAKPEKIMAANVILGTIATDRGRLDYAEERLSVAVDLARQLDDPLELGRSLGNLGRALQEDGKTQLALERLKEAAQILRPTGQVMEISRNELALGTLYYNEGQLDEAEAAFRRANAPNLREHSNLFFRSMVRMNLANVFLAKGQLHDAEALWRDSIRGWREVDAHLWLANSLDGLAETLIALGDTQKAIPLYTEALAIVQELPDDAWARRMNSRFTQTLQDLESLARA